MSPPVHVPTSSDTFHNTLQSFYEIEKGELPAPLTSRSQLSQTTSSAMQSLENTNPGYKLTPKNPLDIYRQNDIAYTIESNSLLLQITLYIRPTWSVRCSYQHRS